MFIHYFTHVPVDLGTVEARIEHVRDQAEDWGSVAYREGEELRARVGPHVQRVAKTVLLELGLPEIRHTGLVYPLKWTAVGAEALFPTLTGSLILTHLGRDKTKLSLEGTYEPPLGWLGRVADRTLLKNLAEATVQDWVDRVAEAVSAVAELS